MTTPITKPIGYRMPAEWEPHDAVWLAWPYDKIDFPQGLEKAETVFAEVISAIHASEDVELLVLDQSMQERVSKMLKAKGVDLSKVHFHIIDYVSYWMRDIALTFLIKSPPVRNRIGGDARGGLAAVKWIFNSWGNKYPEMLVDNEVGYKIKEWLKCRAFEPQIVMEGGAIDVNGSGSLLTTEQCLLNPNRNPNLSREEIENYLREYLAVTNIIWLKEGIVGDDTDGHIDDIARFVNQNTVLAAYEENESDENHSLLKENFDILLKSKDEQGRALNIMKLRMPRKIVDSTGRRLPASYLNFYIGNTVVLVPTFNDPADEKALQIIQKCFPDRKAVGIYAEDLVFALGTFHCISQQQPSLNFPSS